MTIINETYFNMLFPARYGTYLLISIIVNCENATIIKVSFPIVLNNEVSPGLYFPIIIEITNTMIVPEIAPIVK